MVSPLLHYLLQITFLYIIILAKAAVCAFIVAQWESCFYSLMKRYYFVYGLAMLSFSELEFKWSVIHVVDALNQLATCYPYLILFPMIYACHGYD